MNALDYQMGFGFKAQDDYYYGPNGSVGLYHLGDDYYSPLNEPIIVQGTQLGLSGNTGMVGGPHVHVAKWLSGNQPGGYYISTYNRSYYDPSDVKTIIGVVTETGRASASGNFVRVGAENGYTYEFFHMNRIDVKIGDKIGKGEPMVNKGDVENMAGIAGWKPPQNYINFWGDDKHTWHDFMYDLTKQQEFKDNLAKKYGSAEAQAKLNKIKELLQ